MSYLDEALCILKKLIDNGFEAYIVGGYVRDMLLNLESNDIDITTNASIDEIKKLFDIRNNGNDYNSVTIIKDEYFYEITQYRKDVSYYDHRHPNIETTDSIDDDLERRDFTINALCMDYNKAIKDNYNGLLDLKNKIIRCINDPYIRFEEDALRILRALYLVSKLNFKIESNTLNAIYEKAYLLNDISMYRKTVEILKIIKNNKNNSVFKYMIDTNVYNYLNGLDMGIKYIVDKNIVIDDYILFFSLSFSLNEINSSYELAKEDTKKIKNIIALSKNKINEMDILKNDIEVVKYANKLRKLLNKDYIYDIDNMISNLEIKSIKELAINGNDIKNIIDAEPGKWINDLLYLLCEKVLLKKINNDKDELMKYVKKEVKIWKK